MIRSLAMPGLGLFVAVALLACGGGGSGTADCPAGTTNCACRADGTCDTDLTCTQGFCVAVAACPAGSEGCPCYPNGSCDSKDGVVMSCDDTVCKVPGTPPLGDLGDPCDADAPCGKQAGTQLECRDSTCQLPEVACPVGTFGCPCDADTCQAGLECTSDTCQAAAGSGLVVTNADVRACDVLLEKAAGVDVLYAATVLGVTARDEARLALSFSAKADAGFTAPVGALAGVGGSVQDATGVTVSKAVCYDRHGTAVADPGVELK